MRKGSEVIANHCVLYKLHSGPASEDYLLGWVRSSRERSGPQTVGAHENCSEELGVEVVDQFLSVDYHVGV